MTTASDSTDIDRYLDTPPIAFKLALFIHRNSAPKRAAMLRTLAVRALAVRPWRCGLGGAVLAHTGLSFVPSGPASSSFLL